MLSNHGFVASFNIVSERSTLKTCFIFEMFLNDENIGVRLTIHEFCNFFDIKIAAVLC